MIANSTAYRTDTKGSPQAAHFFIYILLTSAVPDATHAWLVMDLYDCNNFIVVGSKLSYYFMSA